MELNNNVTINIVELASELADLELINNWDYRLGDMIIEDDDGTKYTEEAQDIFNDLYDKYYSIIENCKIYS